MSNSIDISTISDAELDVLLAPGKHDANRRLLNLIHAKIREGLRCVQNGETTNAVCWLTNAAALCVDEDEQVDALSDAE